MSHLREKEPARKCEGKPKKALDGITPETELLLRSWKDYKGKSEAERWKKMYWTLFPDDFSMGAGSGTDEINLNWDDVSFPHRRL